MQQINLHYVRTQLLKPIKVHGTLYLGEDFALMNILLHSMLDADTTFAVEERLIYEGK